MTLARCAAVNGSNRSAHQMLRYSRRVAGRPPDVGIAVTCTSLGCHAADSLGKCRIGNPASCEQLGEARERDDAVSATEARRQQIGVDDDQRTDTYGTFLDTQSLQHI